MKIKTRKTLLVVCMIAVIGGVAGFMLAKKPLGFDKLEIGGEQKESPESSAPDSVASGNILWAKNDAVGGTKSWLAAMEFCQSLGPGWRLPTIAELESAQDAQLPNIRASNYWSSSEVDAGSAYFFTFNLGGVYTSDKSSSLYVRCVQGQ